MTGPMTGQLNAAAVAVLADGGEGHQVLEALLDDYLWKVGIVAVVVVLAVIAAVVIWRRVG